MDKLFVFRCYSVGIPMGTNRLRLVTDMVLFCYAKDIMSLSEENHGDVIAAVSSMSVRRRPNNDDILFL